MAIESIQHSIKFNIYRAPELLL